MNRVGAASLLLLATAVLAADPPVKPVPVAAKLVNAADARRALGLTPEFDTVPRAGQVKVAVLDSGFEGAGGDRPYLPQTTTVVEHYDPEFVRRNQLGDPNYKKPFAPGNAHGRLMAQVVWETTGRSPAGPQFFLLNANGPTLFRRAVRYAIEQGVDVILFAGTFEGAGNYDGRGPVNAAVDEAVAAGIVWVNAAGNYGGTVYNGPVDRGPDGFLRFRGTADPKYLQFTNRFDENAVTLTLTWNDYRDAEDAGTDKDLDLLVEDWDGKAVGISKLTQVPPGKPAGDGETTNPRERVVLADLPASPPGKAYRVRVLARQANFGPRDRIRLLLTTARNAPFTDPDTGKTESPVKFLDASKWGEIYPPADHPGVLTVGDANAASSVGPTADGRVKPDVVVNFSTARFSNGDETAGSSNAAAYFAGVVAAMRAAEPGLTTGHVRAWVRRLDAKAGIPSATVVAAKPAAPQAAAVSPAVVPATLPNAGPPPYTFPGPSGPQYDPQPWAFPYPPPAAPGVPPPPPFPSTPNQARAMRYTEYALDQQQRLGERAPQVWVTTPIGQFVIRPGTRPVVTVTPRGGNLPAMYPSLPVTSAPSPPGTGVGVWIRPKGSPDPQPAAAADRPAPHAAWRTPTRRELADLVRDAN